MKKENKYDTTRTAGILFGSQEVQKMNMKMEIRNFAGFSKLGPGEMYADPLRYVGTLPMVPVPGGGTDGAPTRSPQFAFSRKLPHTAPPKIN